MNVSPYQIWFILAALLAVVEMLSGTFYLFMLAIAAFAGGLAAWWGAAASAQIAVAALAAIAGFLGVRRLKHVRHEDDVSLDVGNRVEWLGNAPNGYWRVRYRGTEWQAQPDSPDTTPNALLVVSATRGNLLVVKNIHPARHGEK